MTHRVVTGFGCPIPDLCWAMYDHSYVQTVPGTASTIVLRRTSTSTTGIRVVNCSSASNTVVVPGTVVQLSRHAVLHCESYGGHTGSTVVDIGQPVLEH